MSPGDVRVATHRLSAAQRPAFTEPLIVPNIRVCRTDQTVERGHVDLSPGRGFTWSRSTAPDKRSNSLTAHRLLGSR